MKLVVIESPLSGDFVRNVRYSKLCMLDCLINHGEAPYASHLLYTQMLDDENPGQRKLGMEAGFAWGDAAKTRVVYQDLGMSGGMRAGIEAGKNKGQEIIYRNLPKDLMDRLDDGSPIGATKGF